MIVPLLGLFFIFLYLYHDFLKVSKKIQDKIQRDIVKDIRDHEKEIIVERDNECLYNHENLCQEMLIVD